MISYETLGKLFVHTHLHTHRSTMYMYTHTNTRTHTFPLSSLFHLYKLTILSLVSVVFAFD